MTYNVFSGTLNPTHSIFFFYLLLFFPRLISAAAHHTLVVYHTSTHGVALVCANLECRSEMCCARLAENAGPKKSPKIGHLGTIAQLCRAISSQLRHIPTIGKKLVKQQYLLHMSPQYGPLAAEIDPVVWGTTANFNRFRVLAALLHGTVVVDVSQTLRR